MGIGDDKGLYRKLCQKFYHIEGLMLPKGGKGTRGFLEFDLGFEFVR